MNHQCMNWQESRLGEVIIGNPEYGINAAAEAFDFNKLTYLRITDIDDQGKLLQKTLCSISHPQSNDYLLNRGDIVFARTGASVGKTYIYQNPEQPLVYAGFLIRVKPNPDVIVPYFLFLQTQTKKYKNWIVTNSMRSGQPGINSNELKTLPITLPSLNEQQKIAQALTDADNYISALEKLIEKKKMIKEGLMVNLLTGKQLLKEFAFNADGTAKGYKDSELGKIPEDWNVTCLGEHVTYIGSGRTNTQNSGEFPLYGSTGVIGSCKEAEYQGDSILVARVGANAGKVNSVTGLYGVSDNTIIIKLNDATDLDFIKYLLIKKNLNNIVFGSGQPLITGSQLRELLLVMPTKTEQTAIANVLKNIDIEIITFTSKLKKIYQIKQGMMQKLLTGEIRLA